MKSEFSQPIEKPRGAAYGCSYHICYSRKLGRCVTAFTGICFDELILLEMDHKVESFCERPLNDVCYIDGKSHAVEPDIFVKYADGSTVFEWVCYAKEELKPGADVIEGWSRQTGNAYRIVTADDIYAGSFYMRNMHCLASRSRRAGMGMRRSDTIIVNYIRENSHVTIGELIAKGLISKRDGMTYIADMYYRGKLCIPGIREESIMYRTEVALHEG